MLYKHLVIFSCLCHLAISFPKDPDPVAETCQTESDSIDPGVECVFPFRYKEVEYIGCIPDADDKTRRWCPTETDSNGNHVKGKNKYGFCSETCPAHFVEDELKVTKEADETPNSDVCDFKQCNGMKLTSEKGDLGQCQATIQTGENFCYVNQDSVCDKYPFAGKPGTFVAITPCKDPLTPRKRFISIAFAAVIAAITVTGTVQTAHSICRTATQTPC